MLFEFIMLLSVFCIVQIMLQTYNAKKLLLKNLHDSSFTIYIYIYMCVYFIILSKLYASSSL